MYLTLTSLTDDDVYSIEANEDTDIQTFKLFIEHQAGISTDGLVLISNGKYMNDLHKRLSDYGLRDGDVICYQRVPHPLLPPTPQSSAQPRRSGGKSTASTFGIDFSAIKIPSPSRPGSSRAPPQAPVMGNQSNPNPEVIRHMFLADAHQLSFLRERNQPLAEAVHDAEKFKEVFLRQQNERVTREKEKMRIMADPLHPDAQKLIAEEIRLHSVNENMETAMEFAPESFGTVTMLYINCKVNHHPVKAFVDSGAQMTIMSKECAERCNVMHLLDTRWAGIAKGVGTQKILGRAHLVQVQIENIFLPTSFSILEAQPMDMLLGLDMLKRHQCCIDLRNNKLLIGTSNTETPFLSEAELPEFARGNAEELSEDGAMAQALANSTTEVSQSTSNGEEANASTSSEFPEAMISKLCDMGFERGRVLAELRKHGGDFDQTIAELVSKGGDKGSSSM